MKPWLSWLDRHAEESVAVILLLCLVLGVNFEVFRRYALHSSGAYMEEISRLTLIALVYLGIPYVARTRGHILCDVIPASAPRCVQRAVSLFGNAMFLVFSLSMVYGGWKLVVMQIAIDKRTEAMHAPMFVFTALILIGFGLTVVRLIQNLGQDLRAAAPPAP